LTVSDGVARVATQECDGSARDGADALVPGRLLRLDRIPAASSHSGRANA
jgi:hypothetical protein